MRVKRIQATHLGPTVSMKVLVVEEGDPTPPPCENCGKPNYNHPDIAKDDMDWCINCNDILLRGRMTLTELDLWSLYQISRGKIIAVAVEGE